MPNLNDKSQTKTTQEDGFLVRVDRAGEALCVNVNGSESFVDAFEFSAPFGNSQVRRVMRLEVGP